MPTWGEILKEINQSRAPQGTGPDFDGVRRQYLRRLHDLTGRAVILYSTAFLESRPIPPADIQISLADMQGFMEAASNITERNLDLILHSPGGSAEAAESIVDYLRQRFDHIRVFVPLAAMSAATMLALSADEIIMGEHSQLGPIDPQFIISTPEGPRSAPAKAILNQFELAKQQCKNTSNLGAWMPILRSYAPGLLNQCENSRQLAVTMVSNWLEKYMFANDNEGATKADNIAKWFADYDSFKSHARPVGRSKAAEIGVKVTPLENEDDLQDAVLSVHHATMHTFSGTLSTKLIENHHGRAWVHRTGQILVQPVPTPAPSIPTTPSRAERRRLARGKR
jgi:hypothetical protein